MRQVVPVAPSLYVHVPFCVVKCPYCDFYSAVESGDPVGAYLDAVVRELSLRARGLRPETVFVGGGTPTFLTESQTEQLIQALCAWVDLSSVREFTVECNPESVRPEKIRLWLNGGATRFSLGVQSFDDSKLAFLGRAHDAQTARRAFSVLREAGCADVNVDLMFAVPGETPERWSRDLDAAIALRPDHVSAYGLTIEAGTEFGRLAARGNLVECDDETWRALFLLTRSRLSDAGCPPYEISNFARPGRECRHNINYWRNGDYLGVGPSAVSFLEEVRRRNVADWRKYVTAIRERGDAAVFEEKLDATARVPESLLLGLRLETGLSRSEFLARYGVDLFDRYAPQIDRLTRSGLLEKGEDRLALTSEGRLVANTVIEAFLP